MWWQGVLRSQSKEQRRQSVKENDSQRTDHRALYIRQLHNGTLNLKRPCDNTTAKENAVHNGEHSTGDVYYGY